MYNEKTKNEYLQYKKQAYLNSLFDHSEQYEMELKKDLCDMDTTELIHYLISYDSYSTFEDKRRQISNYVEWCVIKGYTPFNWISPKVMPAKKLKEIFLTAKEELYISPAQYREYKDKLMSSGYGVYIASVFSSIYEGISGTGFYNLANMRLPDIDEAGQCIQLPDGTRRDISAELVELLQKTANISAITNEKTVRYVSSVYPDSIWKIRKNKEVTFSKMQRKFIYLIDEMKGVLGENKLSKTAIERSGYFNQIYYKVLEDGVDIRGLNFGADKIGRIENRSYEKYFEDSNLNMDMRKFVDSYRSYLSQL